MSVGGYVDPAHGRRLFGAYAEAWLSAQVFRDSTRERVERNLRVHIAPTFASRRLATIRPSEIQAWVRRTSETLAPGTVKIVYRLLASVFRAAVNDGLIATSPCREIKLPRVSRGEVAPIATEDAQALITNAPEHLRALIVTLAGTGMRQGEVLGLTVDRIDFLRRTIRVDRQLVSLKGQSPKLGPPKTESSMRTIPVPSLVIDALADHLARFPVDGDGFVFTTVRGKPWARDSFLHAFTACVARAGLAKTVTSHDLRHYYASLLIRHGESVKTVHARLGHASAVETLNTYAHLWPDSDDRTREAVERAFADNSRPARGLEAQ
jgi:integrase